LPTWCSRRTKGSRDERLHLVSRATSYVPPAAGKPAALDLLQATRPECPLQMLGVAMRGTAGKVKRGVTRRGTAR
jgi:hypothetical protein